MNINYQPFDTFVFRVPLLPNNSADAHFYGSTLFESAICIASPDLFMAYSKKGNKKFESLSDELKISLIKYLTRMSSRCTPFGLFAGCGTGRIGNDTAITLEGPASYRMHTRLDMNYLCNLIQHLCSLPEAKELLRYYPNSSLYELASGYRYIEYKYSGKVRKHFLNEVDHSSYLENVLVAAGSGFQKSAIIDLLTATREDDITAEDATAYIEELIDNQILVSCLDPAVTGHDMLTRLLQLMKQLEFKEEIYQGVANIQELLLTINGPEGSTVAAYQALEKEVAALPVPYEKKNLLQVDTTVNATTATINRAVIQELEACMLFMNRMTKKMESNALKNFRESFLKRYEEQEIPLTEVLDSDIGIGFSNYIPGNTDINPLIDDLHITPPRTGSAPGSSMEPFEILMYEKYLQAVSKGESEIVIEQQEIPAGPVSWDDLPFTISAMLEVINTGQNGKPPLILLNHLGGGSATKLLGRFCNAHEGIHELVKEVAAKEDELAGDNTIIAEIVHLPESRVGNILFRPVLSKYEIPYLANHGVNAENCIHISDIMVSVKRDRIRLRSAKLNKTILPRLSSAHNYAANSSPIYHFLCEMQHEGIRPYLYFDRGKLLRGKKYIPRVRYQQVILAPAEWNIKAAEMQYIDMTAADFSSKVRAFKEDNRIPDKVLLVKGDNKLLIDFNDSLAIQLLFSEIKDHDTTLEEYIYDGEDALIRQGQATYNNQLIVCFYKNMEH